MTDHVVQLTGHSQAFFLDPFVSSQIPFLREAAVDGLQLPRQPRAVSKQMTSHPGSSPEDEGRRGFETEGREEAERTERQPNKRLPAGTGYGDRERQIETEHGRSKPGDRYRDEQV